VLGNITDWILSLGPGWAVAVVFLGPALESSAFLGFVFPGELAVVLGGVLAFQGRVSLQAVMVAAVLGAIVGDTVGYWVGRRWGHQILRGIGSRIPFLKHRVDDHLERARAYLKRRGGMAVLVGRFTTALRVMVPGLAGMADMHYPTFFAFNAVGGVVWGTAFVLLGYYAGATWQHAARFATEAGLALLALVILGLVAFRLLRNVREGDERVPDRLARIRPVAWFRRSLPRASAWLAHRVETSSPRGFVLSFVVLVGAFSAWLFVAMTQDVVGHEEAVGYDPGVLRFAVDHREHWLTGAMKAITWVGSNEVLIPLVGLACAWLLWRHRAGRLAIGVVAALGGVNLLYDLTKSLVARPRPPAVFQLVRAGGFAFPSGHVAQALAALGAVAIALSSGRPLRIRVLAGVGTAVVVLLIGLSRVYLGVHWLTDVLGGLALGGLWLSLVGVVTLWTAPSPVNSPQRETA
jgi:membrane protein DedA with SNARE-associated domain